MVLHPKLKRIANILLLALIVGAFVAVLCVVAHRKNAEIRRIRENYEAELAGERSVQQTIDLREFKEYFAKEVATLKEHGIPARNVEHIIEVSYVYRDTIRYRDTLVYVYDTIKASRTADFCVSAGCYDIGGTITDDTIEIASVAAYDDILVALYKERRKCLLQKQRVRAIAVSSCSGDTLAIKRNLKIER